ncbi:hypothetical protein [Spirosoma daeguense]
MTALNCEQDSALLTLSDTEGFWALQNVAGARIKPINVTYRRLTIEQKELIMVKKK